MTPKTATITSTRIKNFFNLPIAFFLFHTSEDEKVNCGNVSIPARAIAPDSGNVSIPACANAIDGGNVSIPACANAPDGGNVSIPACANAPDGGNISILACANAPDSGNVRIFVNKATASMTLLALTTPSTRPPIM